MGAIDNYQHAIDILMNDTIIRERINDIRFKSGMKEFIDDTDEKMLESNLSEDFVIIGDDKKKDLTELNASEYNNVFIQDKLSYYTDFRHKTKNTLSFYCTIGTVVGASKFALGLLL